MSCNAAVLLRQMYSHFAFNHTVTDLKYEAIWSMISCTECECLCKIVLLHSFTSVNQFYTLRIFRGLAKM